MAKPVMITADSTCDMSPELLERYKVRTVPLGIVIGQNHFHDGVDITPDDIYAYHNREGILPKTTAVSPEEYKSFFRKFTDSGYAVVHLNLSSRISSTHQNAILAAAELENVYPVDTLSLCTGMAMLVIKACEMRDRGVEAKVISGEVRGMIGLVRTSFILNNLEFLSKGGRCSSLTAIGANLLGIRPCIEMADGEMFVGKKYRGKLQSCYEKYAKCKITSSGDLDLDRVILSHSGVSSQSLDRIAGVIKENADFKEIHITRAGCTITSHCGPDTVAVIFMLKT